MSFWIRRWTTPPAMAGVNSHHLRNLSDLSDSSDVVLWLQTYPESESTVEECPCGHTVE